MKYVTLFLFLTSHFLFGQSLVGKWQNTTYGYSFEFTSANQYVFNFPAQNIRNLEGTYVKKSDAVYLKNPYGSVTYAVRWVGNILQLSDSQGTWTLSKVGDKGFLDPTKFSRIIAQKEGHQLTEAGPKTYESIINFVLDQKVNALDYQVVANETKRMFLKNPEVILGDIKAARESFEQILQNGDPSVIGQFRQAFLGQVYQMAVIDQNPDMQVFWSIFDKYIDVHSFDANTQLVLTSADLESYLNYIDLLNLQQGGTKLDANQRKLLSNQTIANFSNMRLNEKKFLANAGMAYQLVRNNLSNFTTHQTQMFRQQYTPKTQPAMMNQQMDADLYQRYSRMMLESHVSMLNGIENLGGTGDYWEIKPSYGW